MPQEERALSSKELISAERVMQLWSVSEWELVEEIKRGNFAVLFCGKKPRKSPDGDVLFLCWEGTYKNIPNESTGLGSEVWYDFSVVYFYAIDISGHQIQFPYLTMPTADDDEISQCDDFISTAPEWMPAHEARVVIGMTPINFVEFLNSGRLETDREQERLDFAKTNGWDSDNVPFFKTNDLDALRVHKASFADYTSELYAGRKIDSRILKYYESKERAADIGDVDSNGNAPGHDSPVFDIIGTSEEWIDMDIARKMLQMTPKEFSYLLNTGQIETNIEEDRAYAYNDYINSSYTDRDFFFFTKDKIGKFLVNAISVKRYAENSFTSLNESKGCSGSDINDERVKAHIAELEGQLQELRQENESLKAGVSEVGCASADCENCPSNQSAEQRLDVFKMGVRMALRCAADGSEQSKEGHLALWRELHKVKAGKPNSRCFDAFRAVLDEAPHLKCPDPRQK